MEKAVLYPFDNKLVPFIRHWNTIKESPRIMSVVTNESKGLLGRDIGEIKNQGKLGIKIHSDLVEELSQYDTLFIVNGSDEQDNMHEKIIFYIKEALRMSKDIICMHTLSEQEQSCFFRLAKDNKTTFKYIIDPQIDREIEYIPKKLYRPDATIIMIGEMFQNLGGLQIALGLNHFLQTRGYRTIVMTEQKWPMLEDIVPYPVFLKGRNCREDEKVYYLNNYIRYLENTREIDGIIMVLPDAMLKYNNQMCNGFGILPFIISQAVCADYFIFCTQYGILEDKFYNSLSLLFQYRYGFEIDSIHMSNSTVDMQDFTEKGRLSFLNRNISEVDKVIESYHKGNSIPILNCARKEDFESMCENMLNKLSAYGDIQCIM